MNTKTLRTARYGAVEFVGFLMMLLMLFPIILVFINSAKPPTDVTSDPLALPTDITRLFTNIAEIWSNPNVQYPQAFAASMIITTGSLGLLMLIAAQAAWVLVRSNSKFSQIIFFIFVAAMVIPFQVLMLPLVRWFRDLGVLIDRPILRTYGGMIFAYIGFGLPLTIFIFHGFIKSIPRSLEEAATMDGCGPFQTFYLIVMPLLKPIVATAMILNGIWIWNDYLLPLLILGKGNSIQTIPLAVANYAGAFVVQWDLLLTAVLLAMIPVIIIFLIAQRSIIKGMISGAVKQ